MRITLFTDPHLGTSRAAHTTRESSKRLTQALYQQALEVASSTDITACLGDLFDRSQNSEDIIVQGFEVARRCKWTLAGNHDSTNRSDTVTSLDALQKMGCSIVASKDLSTAYFLAEGPIYFVPHHASQALFERALKDAGAHATKEREGKASVLMLHCNYDFGFASEDDTLNLSAEASAELLEAFDYIFLGHEHNPSSHHGGRLVVLGNTHATSFSDISDKFSYTLEVDDASIQLTKTCIWSKATSFAEVRLGAELPDLSEVQFVDVTGIADAAGALEVAEFIQTIWKAGPELLAVRNSVQIGDHLAGTNLEDSRPALVDLKATIAEDLAGSDLLPLYQKLLQELSV